MIKFVYPGREKLVSLSSTNVSNRISYIGYRNIEI